MSQSKGNISRALLAPGVNSGGKYWRLLRSIVGITVFSALRGFVFEYFADYGISFSLLTREQIIAMAVGALAMACGLVCFWDSRYGSRSKTSENRSGKAVMTRRWLILKSRDENRVRSTRRVLFGVKRTRVCSSSGNLASVSNPKL